MESGDDDVVSEDLSVETSSCIGKMSIIAAHVKKKKARDPDNDDFASKENKG